MNEIENIESTLEDLQNDRQSIAGTTIKSGKIQEDYLALLNDTKNMYDTYDKMRRQDYQIKRLENVLTAPIKGANFRFDPKDYNDEKQVEQAKFKNSLYFDWADRKWQDMLNEILTYPLMGFTPFEPYSKIIDEPDFGQIITLANLGYIKQSTVVEWDIQDDKVIRIRQKANDGKTTYDKWIDGSELIIMTNQLEGNNFQGISVLRAAYGPYIRKELYLKLDMIGNERMAIGTPIIYVPKTYFNKNNTALLAEIEKILQAYTSHQKAYLVFSEVLKDGGFDILKGEYNSDAVDTSIKREDLAILDSILAGFLAIGTQKSGGNAQNEGQMELYLNSLMFIGEYICEVLSQLAHRYYVVNFGPPEVRLDMKVSGIKRNDAKKVMEVIRGYATSKIIEPDDRLEKFVRKELNLPEKEFETARKEEMTPDYKSDQDDQDKENPDKQNNPEPNINEGDK